MIVLTDITPESHGNASGVGLADIITRRLYRKIDFASTYENVITANFLERAKIPLVAETTRKACAIALRAAGPLAEGEERILRIRDTLHLEEVYVSPAILGEIQNRVEVLKGPGRLFDRGGELTGF